MTKSKRGRTAFLGKLVRHSVGFSENMVDLKVLETTKEEPPVI